VYSHPFAQHVIAGDFVCDTRSTTNETCRDIRRFAVGICSPLATTAEPRSVVWNAGTPSTNTASTSRKRIILTMISMISEADSSVS
jgi:hypothetical protein